MCTLYVRLLGHHVRMSASPSLELFVAVSVQVISTTLYGTLKLCSRTSSKCVCILHMYHLHMYLQLRSTPSSSSLSPLDVPSRPHLLFRACVDGHGPVPSPAPSAARLLPQRPRVLLRGFPLLVACAAVCPGPANEDGFSRTQWRSTWMDGIGEKCMYASLL